MEERLKYNYMDVKKRCKELLSLVDELSQMGTFFGATGENVIDLISEYDIRGGKHPMTTGSIIEAFRPDKIKIGIIPKFRKLGEQERAQWAAAAKCQERWATGACETMREAVLRGCFESSRCGCGKAKHER